MVTNIEIIQDNFVGDCKLLAAHSNLLFIAEATYTGTPPDYLIVELTTDGLYYLTGKAIYYSDSATNKRQFLFDASEFVKALISQSIDDFQQGDGSIIETDVSKVVTINFKSDLTGTIQRSIDIEAINAMRVTGEQVAVLDVYNNSEPPYYAIEGEPVYIYFYGSQMERETKYALDYDDGVFLDYNGDKFTID